MDQNIIIHQDTSVDRIAGKIWEAAPFLITYLQCDLVNILMQNRYKRFSVLKLGSGTGYVGIHVARMLSNMVQSGLQVACNVVLTDIEAALPLIQNNISRNLHLMDESTIVKAKEYDWNDYQNPKVVEDTKYDLILISDCVYWEHLHLPLLNAIDFVTSHNEKAEVLISYRQRELVKEYSFFDQLGVKFSMEIISQDDRLRLIKCRRKQNIQQDASYDDQWWSMCLNSIDISL
ncbi:hypothetical protein MP228_011062 [Amoeboaphelidium protococcarum]|nr:hypothetical protein MP228_011062 [Amoeboaphelidium protococcarum]